jgi:predicted RNase H-like nuclease (RuvC/YqgF family)
MTNIVEKLRERPHRLMSETDEECKARRQREREEGAAEIERLTKALAEAERQIELMYEDLAGDSI